MKNTLLFIMTIAVLVLCMPLSSCSCDISLSDVATLDLYGIDPYTLDPALSGDATSHQYITQIFSGLVKFDSGLQIVGDIAKDWEMSPDGFKYLFRLRPEAVFHDGRQVTAGDFKNSWERACNPLTGSQTAALYFGDILGATEVIKGEASEITGVRVIDNFTLEVTLKEPKNYFLYKIAYPAAYVVDTKTIGSKDWWQKSVNGTGPFKLREWKRGSYLELEKFNQYYGQVAKLDRVVYHLWAGVPMDLYEAGSIDVAEIGGSYIDKATDENNRFWDELRVMPVPSLTFIGFNFQAEPFDDPLVRRAFLMATDVGKIVELTYQGAAVAAYGVVPPGIPGHCDGAKQFEYDPDLAREIIGLSSYGSCDNLPPITLTTGGYGGLVPNDLQAAVYQWRENLGVNVTVRQLEPAEFYYNLIAEKDQLFYFGWVADYPHPQNFLEVLFASGSPTNVGEYANQKFDILIDRAGSQLDASAGTELYQQAERMLLADTALIPVSFGIDMVLVKPYVHGYIPSPLGAVALNEVWIEGK